MHWRYGSVALVTTARTLLLVILVALALVSSGCAVLRRRGQSDEGVAAARELSRQGVAAMESGKWQQAEEMLSKAVEGAPDDTSTRRSLAEALWHRNARQEALAQIEKAIEQDENNAELRVRAGEMSLANGELQNALGQADRAIRNDPQLAAAWALRGKCFTAAKLPDRAIADLQHALEFEPNNQEVLLQVAMLYRQRGQAARSLTTLHHLLDTYANGEEPQQVLTLEGLTLIDLGRPHQACECLVAANSRGKPTVDGLYHLAQAYSAAGQPGQATVVAQQALALNASHEPSRKLLTQLAAQAPAKEPTRR
jgi:tetratricopeptide (TPR) repeat protein